ncbi:MAG: cell division protein FtsA, partial [Acetobacter sp.]|nr:cell division protein FtsA [Acetobacter sp.]
MSHIHSLKNNQYSQPWRQGYYAALDIGSTKIICLIGKGKPKGILHVEGYGWCQSAGIRHGTITDLRAAKAAIRHAIAEAEEMAARSIDRIIINLPCGRPMSRLFNIRYPIGRRVVNNTDLKRIFTAAYKQATTKNREIIHILPVDFIIDNTDCVHDPRGYLCEVLNARIHIIDAAENSITNLKTLISSIGLKVEEIVVSSLASSFSVLNADELSRGVTVIEIGGDTTSLALFAEGHVLHTS